jgi:antitoxin CptB
VSAVAEDLKRLAWHSRRGMLELDLILVPFSQQQLLSLAQDQVQLYRELLAEEDQDLFVWLMRRGPAPSERLQQIVDIVLASRTAAKTFQG